MSKKKNQKEFVIYVNRDVLFEAKIKANPIREALETAEGMSTDKLWETPGDIIDDGHTITAVFE